jgi:hypothetical protein
MLERQREVIAKAKAAGKYKGRARTAMAKVEAMLAAGVNPRRGAEAKDWQEQRVPRDQAAQDQASGGRVRAGIGPAQGGAYNDDGKAAPQETMRRPPGGGPGRHGNAAALQKYVGANPVIAMLSFQVPHLLNVVDYILNRALLSNISEYKPPPTVPFDV